MSVMAIFQQLPKSWRHLDSAQKSPTIHSYPIGERVFNPMRRSTSVTWAAIATILESLPPLGVGVLAVLDLFGIAPHRGRNPTIFYSGFEILSVVVMMMIPGIWALATGIGLLAVKRWARYSIIAFAALTIAFMGITFGFGMMVMLAMAKRNPFPTMGMWGIAYYVGVPVFYVGISVWFLLLFNRPGVAEEFEGGAGGAVLV